MLVDEPNVRETCSVVVPDSLKPEVVWLQVLDSTSKGWVEAIADLRRIER
jgi:hypothetical protein